MIVNVIVRIDDVSDRFDFFELEKWFLTNYPKIPISFYVNATQYPYRWRKKGWISIKKVITNYKWEIGGHTRSHPHLPKLTHKKLEEEIVKNLSDIQNNLNSIGLPYLITSFSYPYGEFDERVKIILKKNGIIHGLTYTSGEEYESQLDIPYDNLYEIGISCNATNSIENWNNRFNKVYNNGNTYILCLHTPLWRKANNRSNLVRIVKSKSIKELFIATKRFCNYLFKKSSSEMWDKIKLHLDFIIDHSNIQFITFKDLLK